MPGAFDLITIFVVVFTLWLFRQPPRAVPLALTGLFPERMRPTTLRHLSDPRTSHRGGPVDHLLAPLDALAGTTPGLVRDVTKQCQTDASPSSWRRTRSWDRKQRMIRFALGSLPESMVTRWRGRWRRFVCSSCWCASLN